MTVTDEKPVSADELAAVTDPVEQLRAAADRAAAALARWRRTETRPDLRVERRRAWAEFMEARRDSVDAIRRLQAGPLPPRMVDLAKVVGVTRTTLYTWIRNVDEEREAQQ